MMEAIQMVQLTPEQLTDKINQGLKIEIEKIVSSLSNKAVSTKEFLTRKETAKYFSISLVCLHDWVKKGIVKPYKMGRRTYFMHSELVDALLNSNRLAS